MGSVAVNGRIDTLELRSLITKKIGSQRADRYFDHLRHWFSAKLTKTEFDRLCVRTLGRENISLHNRLITAIAKNACVAKAPPERGLKKCGSNHHVKVVNGYQRSCLQSLHGDAFPHSPRKGRSHVSRDRKLKDRPSPLGPLGKPQSTTELLSLGSRPPVEVASVEDGEEVEQITGSPGVQSRGTVTPPLGISMNLGGPRKTLSHSNSMCSRCNELPDTRSLKSRLGEKLDSEGINMTLDCANLLNNALDVYLKRLIEPCIALAGARCRNVSSKDAIKQHAFNMNGLPPTRKPQTSFNASMIDLCVAMELNPKLLGVDWPVHLEKVFLRSLED